MDNASPHSVRNWIITVAVLLILLIAAYFYVEHQKKYPNTNDAYVHGNMSYDHFWCLKRKTGGVPCQKHS
ncbi:hypothetical protein [Endozoicomonas atrinae]|uniref:hypothetical protein n=1 Tax=Endozoicomonas atrinae TaxID=1333660 RepID=UPI003AFFD5FB